MHFLLRQTRRLAGVLLVVIGSIYFLRAIDARRMPSLGPEHRIRFENEFSADREPDTDWQAYLAIEDELAAELDTKIRGRSGFGSLLDRYSRDSLTYPGRIDANWNRSYELTAIAPRGVAVLLHGLSDSPYSMLSTAETLVSAGYDVIVPRMPGHGFAAGGLLRARAEDWSAAVRVAVRHGMQLAARDRSFVMVGYSNGGLMALDFALRCKDLNLRCPDRLVLLSPAIEVTPLAAVANWHAAISWMPYFEKFGWLSILPEVDPFKFTSFPKRAAWEIYKVSRRVHDLLDEPAGTQSLPPILTFQSIVDKTVSSRAVIDSLYSRLPPNGSQLILYDLNRNNTATHLMRRPPDDPLALLAAAAPLRFDVTVLRNRSGAGLEVDLTSLRAGDTALRTMQTPYSWPADLYSLSHISLPFRPDDKWYGDGKSPMPEIPRVDFGAMAPRGENGVLLLSPEFFLRSRHNPFYRFQAESILQWLASQQ
jgi:alpha-beta hydrolase superfamily lysophospholipase